MRAKVCPHVNRTRTPHPHRQTAPPKMSHTTLTYQFGLIIFVHLCRNRGWLQRHHIEDSLKPAFFPGSRESTFYEKGKLLSYMFLESFVLFSHKENSSCSDWIIFWLKTFFYLGDQFLPRNVILNGKVIFFSKTTIWMKDEIFITKSIPESGYHFSWGN